MLDGITTPAFAPSAALPVRAIAPSATDHAATPTVDLYLGFADMPGVRMVAPTVALLGEALIVFRHARGLRLLPPHRRLIYVIDDDVAAGLRDPALPLSYRAHLAATAGWGERRWLPRADHVVASTPRLADRLRARGVVAPIHVLPPAWPAARMARPRSGPIRRIVLSMGRSHARDTAPMMPMLARLLARWPDLLLEVTGARLGTSALWGQPRATCRDEQPWPTYWRGLIRRRADLALVPHLAGGPFNAARSGAKLGEHAATGAAVLAQAGWAAGDAAVAAGQALSAPATVEGWEEAIEAILHDPRPARRAAMAAWHHHASGEALDVQRAAWADLAGLA